MYRGHPDSAAGKHACSGVHRVARSFAILVTLLCSLATVQGQARVPLQAIPAIPGSYLQSNFTTGAVTVAQAVATCHNGSPAFPVVEANISGIHSAFLAQRLTCSQLVTAYEQRIQEYDQRLGLNSVRVLNPSLSREAAAKDSQLLRVLNGSEALPPLFCVPLLVKDNYDTLNMAASNGAAGLMDNVASADAQQVALLKSAGALVLGKANMAEWAFSPEVSVGSAFGVVRNPYATDFSSAGSSGGTAAGVAASFAMAGLGTDTGNSIRGPAGWNSLVGLRPSFGLSSRTGIIPLDVTSDMGGPLARTVEDAVRLFEVTVGIDPSDNYTSLQSAAAVPANYTQFLDPNGLKGMRVGVMLQTIDNTTASPEVMQLFRQALVDMQAAGATLVNNFTISGNALGDRNWSGGSTWPTGYGNLSKEEQLDCGAHFKSDINSYLANASSRYKSIQSLVMDGQYHPSANLSMTLRLDVPYSPWEYPTPTLRADGYVCTCGDYSVNPCRAEFRKRLVASMNATGVSVLALPTWSNPPLRIGDYASPSGNNSPQISPPTGAPALAVPMGFVQASQLAPPLPASLQLIARPFDEASLIRAGYAYEQRTLHRRPPAALPECTGAGAPSPSLTGRIPNRSSG